MKDKDKRVFTRNCTQQDLRLAKLCLFPSKDDVTHHRQLTAPAQLKQQRDQNKRQGNICYCWHFAACTGKEIHTANPFTAAITGFLVVDTLFQWDKKFPEKHSWKVRFCISFISAPAEKHKGLLWCTCNDFMTFSGENMKKKIGKRKLPLPAKALSLPVMTMAPTPLSASKLSRACPTSLISPSHRAFRAFGRFNWMKPTFFSPPRFSTKMYSYWPPTDKEIQHQWLENSEAQKCSKAPPRKLKIKVSKGKQMHVLELKQVGTQLQLMF